MDRIWLAALCLICLAGCKPDTGAASRRLLTACLNKNLDQVNDALADGADPNVIDKQLEWGWSALDEGAESPEIVKALLKAGASVKKRDGLGYMPLGMVSIAGPVESVDLLLGAGAAVDGKSERGNTALAQALVMGKLDNAKYLIAHGANVNTVNNLGATPLIQLAKAVTMKASDRVAMIRYLIAHGANPAAKDRFGKTVAFYAWRKLRKATKLGQELLHLLSGADDKKK